MNSSEKSRSVILLSVQRALLGAISKDIRGVTCAWNGSTIFIKSFHDGKVSVADKEDMEVVASEVLSDFPGHEVKVECSKVDYPEKLPLDDAEVWVYRRKET